MRTLVTGATGLLGQRLCILLEKKSREVVQVSKTPYKNLYNHFTYDLEKETIDEELIADTQTIFHLAGYAHDLSDSKKVKDKYIRLNIDATNNLALQASDLGVKTFVFVSSVKADLVESKSDRKSSSQNIYGETKREAELNLLELSKKTNMKVCIIRPSLIYGPSLKGNLLQMKKAIQQGWFPPLPEINNTRSMVHVDDLSRAMLIVEERGVDGEIYNVTDGKNYSSTEIFDIFHEILQKNPPILRVPLPILKLLQKFPGEFKHRITKLLEDEIYSSSKIVSLGFNAKLKFRDLDETLF